MNNIYADRQLAFFFKKIKYASLIQPINAEKEKKKVFQSRDYNPQFQYRDIDGTLNTIIKGLKEIKIIHSTLGTILNERRNEIIQRCLLLKKIGTKEITEISKKIYGTPSQELIHRAEKLVKLEPEEEEKKNNTIATIRKMLSSLLGQGFNWNVKEAEKMVAGAVFNVNDRTIYINKNRMFSDNDIKRLMVHEIGTHVIRSEKGRQQSFNIFWIGFPDYLTTEEGLATYNEKKAGLLTNNTLKTYAGRVLAVNLSLSNSFSFTYNSLLEFFSKEEAFTITARAKRGLGNTSKPGAFTKDHVYLKGKYLIEDFVKSGGDIKKLFIGKIAVKHIPLIPKILKDQ